MEILDLDKLFNYQHLEIEKYKLIRENSKMDNNEKIKQVKEFVKTKQNDAISLDPDAKEIVSELEKGTSKIEKGIEYADKYMDRNLDDMSIEELKLLEQKCIKTIENFDAIESFTNSKVRKAELILKKYSEDVANIKKGKKMIKALESEMGEKKNEVLPKIEEIDVKLKNLSKQIQPTLMEKYKSKKENKIFPVLVNLTANGCCGGCGMQLSLGNRDILTSKGFFECEQCKKIIFKKK